MAEEINLPSSVAADTGTATDAISRRMRPPEISSLPVSFFRLMRYKVVRKTELTSSLMTIPQTIRAAA